MEGWSDTEPKGGESLILSLRTNDTRGTETMHDTKRPLKGFKWQFKDVSLEIVEKCPIKSLVKFKHNSTYAGSIYNIGMDPFFI